MSLYVRVFTNFYTHRKTARLRATLGESALWVPPRLWAYAAENQPDGSFDGYSPAEIANLIGYTGDAQAMLQAMLQAGFMDSDPLRIHDWEDHNGYHQFYADRARKAAQAKWDKHREAQKTAEILPPVPLPEMKVPDLKGNEKSQALLQAAPSIASSIPELNLSANQTENPTEGERKGNGKEGEIGTLPLGLESTSLNGFSTFWGAYPKKRSKADAEKAWLKGQLPELSVLLGAIEAQKKTPGWQKSNGQFIPYPASWLNSRCWEDVLVVETKTQKPF